CACRPIYAGALSANMLLGQHAPHVCPSSYDLTHPEQFAMFALEVGLDLAMTSGVVGGIAATVQNYRNPLTQRRTPASLPHGLTAMAALSTSRGPVARWAWRCSGRVGRAPTPFTARHTTTSRPARE